MHSNMSCRQLLLLRHQQSWHEVHWHSLHAQTLSHWNTEPMLIPISSASYWMVIQWSSITKVLSLSIISSFRLVDDLWECVSLSTNVQPFFKGLYHTLIYLIPTAFSPKACWILPMVSFWVFPSFHKIQCYNIFQVIPSFHKLTNETFINSPINSPINSFHKLSMRIWWEFTVPIHRAVLFEQTSYIFCYFEKSGVYRDLWKTF